MTKGFADIPSWGLIVFVFITFPALVILARFASAGEQLIDLIGDEGWVAILREPYEFTAVVLIFIGLGIVGLSLSLVFTASFSVLADRFKVGAL